MCAKMLGQNHFAKSNHHVLTLLHPEFAAPLLLVLTEELWSWEAKLSEGENTWLQICRGRVEDVNIGGEKLGHREIEVCRRFVWECAIWCCRWNCRIYPWNNLLCSWNLLSRFNVVSHCLSFVL
jgi:hypothetical protein